MKTTTTTKTVEHVVRVIDAAGDVGYLAYELDTEGERREDYITDELRHAEVFTSHKAATTAMVGGGVTGGEVVELFSLDMDAATFTAFTGC